MLFEGRKRSSRRRRVYDKYQWNLGINCSNSPNSAGVPSTRMGSPPRLELIFMVYANEVNEVHCGLTRKS